MKKVFYSVLAFLGAGVIAQLYVKRKDSMSGTQLFMRQETISRNMQLAKLGLRGSRRFASYKARRKFASVKHAAALDEQFQLETAQDVTAELGNMKGAMMKIGQMASYLDTGLPENVRTTLASLQQEAPPMSASLAAQQVEEQLGKPLTELFLEWDAKPIAAASIGQVHKAITKEGAAVAVKVQYPGIANAVSADLKNADWIFGGMGKMFPGLDSGSVVQELKERLTEELDYTKEAENQEYFRNYFESHSHIHVPKVYKKYSSEQVLTSELIVGSSFNEALQWSQEEKNQIAETLFRFSFGSIYQLHAFNGDPHPGNYVFHRGGKVTFLDFGLVKRFTNTETVLFENLIKRMVLEGDKKGFRLLVEEAGILGTDASFSDELVHEYFSYFYEYVMEDRILTLDYEYSARGVERLFDMKGEHAELKKQLNVPPSLVVLQRINLGLMGILGQLEATANWRNIAEELWPFVDTSTR